MKNLKKFLKDFDLETLENNDKQFRILDSYLSITPNADNPAKQFVSWAARTLAIYLNENTTPNEDGITTTREFLSN